MEQLFDYQIAKNNMEVLNMLHVKYLIQTNEKGEQFPIENTKTNGNAWFVKQIKLVNSPDAEMKALNTLDTKNIAVINNKEFLNQIKSNPVNFITDENAIIKLTQYQSNNLKYVSNNSKVGYAVFSEMYYKNGWNVYIDGKLSTHERVNFAIRGLLIPAGKHTIEFKFEPQVVKTGSIISLISFILIIILLISAIYFRNKKKLES